MREGATPLRAALAIACLTCALLFLGWQRGHDAWFWGVAVPAATLASVGIWRARVRPPSRGRSRS